MRFEKRYQFIAEALGAGAVSKDGAEVTIEFVAGNELMWVNIPTHLLRTLAKMADELESLACNANNGVATVWHVPASRKTDNEHYEGLQRPVQEKD